MSLESTEAIDIQKNSVPIQSKKIELFSSNRGTYPWPRGTTGARTAVLRWFTVEIEFRIRLFAKMRTLRIVAEEESGNSEHETDGR